MSASSFPPNMPRQAAQGAQSSQAIPMPIRHNAYRDQIPPALPPPRFIPQLRSGQDLGWEYANGRSPTQQQHHHHHYHSNSLSNSRDPAPSMTPSSMAAPSTPSTNMPPDDPSRPAMARLQSEDHLTIRSAYNSAEQFDRHLLSKLDKRRTAAGSPHPPEAGPPQRKPAIQPLSVPNPDSPHTRWPNSPRSASFRSPLSEHHNLQSPRSNPEQQDDPYQHSFHGPYPPAAAAAARHQNEHHSVFSEGDSGQDDHSVRDLNLSDKSPSSQGEELYHGRKRRAPSPPQDSSASYNDGGSSHRRSSHLMHNRHSPGSRHPYPPPHPESMGSNLSYQSAASTNSQWGNSVASSATSYWQGSPAAESDFIPYTPYIAPRKQSNDVRGYEPAKIMPDNARDSFKGQFSCDCCPKKPKRFNTWEELQSHAAEKAWKCNFCSNRFKNKNEAERHQNSLHLRRFSWSCSALVEIGLAFQPNPLTRGATSACGYCGQEFTNTPTENWAERAEHLRAVHKYGDCNQHKKFFRADHFRQHLKHSHAATSGKWTNILETACVRDEPLPVAIQGGGDVKGQGQQHVAMPMPMQVEGPYHPQ